MRCEEIMKRDVRCVSPSESAQQAARRMREEGIGFLPVCDGSGKVLGVVTDRDLTIRVLAADHAPSTRIQEVLTPEVIACRPEDDLSRAEELMARHHKSRIICVDDDGRLVGVISLSDVAQCEDGARASKVLREVSEREVRA